MKVGDAEIRTRWVALTILVTLLLTGSCTFRACCVTFVDNYEIGYTYDTITGKVERLSHPGYILTPPLVVKVHTIDGRPMQVCISTIQRVLNCKLVQFTPDATGIDPENGQTIDGLNLFLKWHGRADYNNSGGTQGTPSQFNQILMAYAYEGSGKSYPFLRIIRELKPEEQEPAQ